MSTSDFRCIKCSGKATGTVVTVFGGLLTAIALAVLALYLVSGDEISAHAGGQRTKIISTLKRPLQTFKIIIVAWQILTQFTNVADVVYPGIYGDFLSGVDIFNFDLGSILSTGCVVDLGFAERIYTMTLGPFAVLSFLAITYVIGMRRHRGTQIAIEIVRRKHLSVVILLTFLMYSSISSILFQTFVCDDIGYWGSVLRADRRIDCGASIHRRLVKYAICMILLYTLGVPVLYAILLFRNRKVLKDETAREANSLAKSTSTLWSLYRPERYYYELVECLRRVFFAAILTFIYPNTVSQVTAGLMIGVMFMLVSEASAPYASHLDAWVSRMGHAVVCTSMIWGILRKLVDVYDYFPEEEMDSQRMFTCIVVAAHVCMVGAVMVEALAVICQLRKEHASVFEV